MKTSVRVVLVVGLLISAFLLSGCFFNVFQTARTLGRGDMVLTLGMGLMNLEVVALGGGGSNPILTPQARLAAGISDGVELGLQSGIMISPAGGQPGFLGVVADLKVSLFDEPGAFALAVGFGGGWSLPMAGWGVQGSVYLDSNLRVLPVYFVYRPIFPLAGEELSVWHQFAAGLHLRLSDTARLLLEADNLSGIWSIGLGLEFGL